jgi:hypothetical protein
MANILPEEGRFSDPNSFTSQVSEYLKIKSSMAFMKERSDELRDKIFAYLDEEGLEDSKGNIYYELDAPIENVVRIEKQRRTSRKVDENVAEGTLTRLGIKDEIYVMVPTIDEGNLMAAYFEGKITEEELDEMYPATVTWALTPKKK